MTKSEWRLVWRTARRLEREAQDLDRDGGAITDILPMLDCQFAGHVRRAQRIIWRREDKDKTHYAAIWRRLVTFPTEKKDQ